MRFGLIFIVDIGQLMRTSDHTDITKSKAILRGCQANHLYFVLPGTESGLIELAQSVNLIGHLAGQTGGTLSGGSPPVDARRVDVTLGRPVLRYGAEVPFCKTIY